MKVNVKEEPAWKRVLDIEVEAQVVDRELNSVVDEYRRRLTLPGFRKGHVPPELARKHMGEDLQGEVLRRILPRAFEDALRDTDLKPIGEPRISNLQFDPGRPLSFTATVEVMPQVEIKDYEGLKLTRRATEIQEEAVDRVLDHLREQHADVEETDRPAQGGDVVLVRHREIDEAGQPVGEGEPVEASLTLGGEQTPEPFNRELMGAVVGDMKKIPLSFPPEEGTGEGTTRTFHVTVAKVQEKIWPALDDALARKILGNEEATVNDLKSRIRLNMEVESRMQSMRELENNLLGRLVELNPFEVPRGVVESTLDRILERAREENPNLPPDEEVKIREQYRPGVEQRLKIDILVDAAGRQEGIEVSDGDLDKEIETFAEQENKPPAQVRAKLGRDGNLDRLREDLYRRRVLDKLVEKADVTVAEPGPAEGEEHT